MVALMVAACVAGASAQGNATASEENRGAGCPKECSNHGTCFEKVCQCDHGYVGTGCAIKACPNVCSFNGRCMEGGVCKCKTGFGGADCSKTVCPNNCGGARRGECVTTGSDAKCACRPGFYGLDCAPACPANCGGNGMCVNGTCYCKQGFSGKDCSIGEFLWLQRCLAWCPHLGSTWLPPVAV